MIANQVPELTLSQAADEDDALLEISLGPHHPSTHGVFRMDVTLDGETCREAQTGFWLSTPQP